MRMSPPIAETDFKPRLGVFWLERRRFDPNDRLFENVAPMNHQIQSARDMRVGRPEVEMRIGSTERTERQVLQLALGHRRVVLLCCGASVCVVEGPRGGGSGC